MKKRTGRHLRRSPLGLLGFFTLMSAIVLGTTVMALFARAQLERSLVQREEGRDAYEIALPAGEAGGAGEPTEPDFPLPGGTGLQDSGIHPWWQGAEETDPETDGEEEAEPVLLDEPVQELTLLGTFTATAYCPCTRCCGEWANGLTYSGTQAIQGRTIAVDPEVIPLGSRVYIDGHEYVAEDVGGGIDGNRLDIFYDSHEAALTWGRKQVEVYLETRTG